MQFAKSAEGAIVVERALHGSFFAQYGITAEVFADTPLSPACHHYVSFLIATAHAEPYEVLLGALLPCFWIYAEVGRDIHGPRRRAQSLPGLDRHLCGRRLPRRRARHDRRRPTKLPATPRRRCVERMHAAFARATQLEWMFWDSAYRLEAWPV